MQRLPTIKSTLLLVAFGTVFGVLSWVAAFIVSDTFEPYDSSLGLLVNQVILTIPAIYLASRYRMSAPMLFLVGAYLGMNAHAYVFGGSEKRAWAVLGSIVSLILIVGPALFAFCTIFLRHLRKPKHD